MPALYLNIQHHNEFKREKAAPTPVHRQFKFKTYTSILTIKSYDN